MRHGSTRAEPLEPPDVRFVGLDMGRRLWVCSQFANYNPPRLSSPAARSRARSPPSGGDAFRISFAGRESYPDVLFYSSRIAKNHENTTETAKIAFLIKLW